VGGWLASWLLHLGARVSGYAFEPPAAPAFFERTALARRLSAHVLGDLGDAPGLAVALRESEPQVVMHLAAQALVREAWREPALTFATNVLGTVNLLEAARHCPSVERIVVYTTDKVYRNDQSGRPFREDDPLGGNEPYSASKAGADWAARAYWESYLRGPGRVALSVVRAGNIVGGGDHARDRLIPDAVRAFAAGEELAVRSPESTRPWQHVLDAVRGTLLLAERMGPGGAPTAGVAWNFGPAEGAVHRVAEVADLAARTWGNGARWRHVPDGSIAEAKALVLSSERARRELGWRCAWGLERAVEASIAWYFAARDPAVDMQAYTLGQIAAHEREAA
jgi:CDP-glucose 4,6-dehydratase